MITYYLATNGVDVFHYGQMEEGMEIVTGQPNLFFYNTVEELRSALESYGQQYREPVYLTIEDLQLPEMQPTEPPLPEE